jgi:hypothetical protein
VGEGAVAAGGAARGAAGTLSATGAATGGWPGCASGGGAAVDRGGSRLVGSTYPWSSLARRTPRWTYGTETSGSPLGPIVPTAPPSSTAAPAATVIEPRCVSVTA